jgi:hypothetical protein
LRPTQNTRRTGKRLLEPLTATEGVAGAVKTNSDMLILSLREA